MADSKITALTALTAADPVNDMFPVVDVSDTSMAASGTTKRISANNILSSSPTASGALTVTGLVTAGSATITGDLTVDTSTFKVNSGNNNVGIGFAGNASSGRLQISQPLGSTIDGALRLTDDATTSLVFNNVSSGLSAIWSSGSIAFGVGSGTFAEAMRLNSTGLGIGVSPTQKLHVKLDQNAYTFSRIDNQNVGSGAYAALMLAASGNTWGIGIGSTAANSNALAFFLDAGGANSVKMTLDTSGSLLIGTTSATVGATAARLHLSADGTDRWAVGPQSNSQHFIIQASNIYGVYLSSLTATSWSSASDERLKDVIEPISNAVSKVGSLRAVIGKFKSDKTNTRKPFLMAQDVLAVLPEAVDVSKPDQFGLAYTDVIPLLVAAIKELTARVQTLEAR